MNLPDFSRARILVFGDVMLDAYVEGTADRLSPEAPVAVVRQHEEARFFPGGAANVAANVAALGADAVLAGVIGGDEARLGALSGVELWLFREASRRTPVKTRIVANGVQLLRLDQEDLRPIASGTEDDLVKALGDLVPACDAVIVSDYAKGAVTSRTYGAIVESARRRGIPIFVDPKRGDLDFYEGAAWLTPNEKEWQARTGFPRSANALVTRGAKGVTLYRFREPGDISSEIQAVGRQAVDTTGAGDTAIAVFAAAIAAGSSPEEAARIANAAAGVAVGKRGTAVVTLDELLEASVGNDNAGTLSLPAAVARRRAWGAAALKVGLANGCFDGLHEGHLELLEGVARRCDRLIVAIDSDASVKDLKGPTRPKNRAAIRASMLAALRCVDAVIVFEGKELEAAIEALRPDLIAKGSDYEEAEIIGASVVKSYGGEVLIVERTRTPWSRTPRARVS